MDGFARDVEAETALFGCISIYIEGLGEFGRETNQASANADDDKVEDAKGDLSRRGEVKTPVHVEPEDTAEAVGEPAGKECGLDYC